MGEVSPISRNAEAPKSSKEQQYVTGTPRQRIILQVRRAQAFARPVVDAHRTIAVVCIMGSDIV